MSFKFGFYDIALLLVILCITLLISLEFMNPRNSDLNFVLDKKKLSKVTFILSFLLLIVLFIRIYQLILTA